MSVEAYKYCEWTILGYNVLTLGRDPGLSPELSYSLMETTDLIYIVCC